MQSILNAIYTERLQNGALTKDQGWAELWNDAGISHAHLNSILSSIEKRYPSDDQTQKHIYCFDMWVYIEAWNQLRGLYRARRSRHRRQRIRNMAGVAG